MGETADSAVEDRDSPSTSIASVVDETSSAEDDGDSSSSRSSASVVVRARGWKRDNKLCRRKEKERKYNCQECDYAATKPALLIQHLRAHSEEAQVMMIRSDQRLHTGSHPNSEKPFSCPVSGCSCTYKRQDHLNRHLKIHEGTRFTCSKPGCDRSFSVKSNRVRHLKRHDEKPDFPKSKWSGEKRHKCLKPGCGKAFRYQSRLQTHEETVHGVMYSELVCLYPGCGDKFVTEAAILKHAVEAHPYLLCEVCGETITRKYYKRHVRNHAARKPVEVSCPYEGCTRHYTKESGLRQHIRSFHLNLKPHICSYDGCGKRFAHRCHRKRHELSAVHVHTGIDFEAGELQFSSRNKGGRKKVRLEKVEDLYLRKTKASQNSPVRRKKPDSQECRVEDMEIG